MSETELNLCTVSSVDRVRDYKGNYSAHYASISHKATEQQWVGLLCDDV